MGMFDSFFFNRVMPDGFDANGVEFQSKDLDCSLTMYEIAADSSVVEWYRWDEPPLKVPSKIHGWVDIYGDGKRYRLKFTDGRLAQIVLSRMSL